MIRSKLIYQTSLHMTCEDGRNMRVRTFDADADYREVGGALFSVPWEGRVETLSRWGRIDMKEAAKRALEWW